MNKDPIEFTLQVSEGNYEEPICSHFTDIQNFKSIEDAFEHLKPLNILDYITVIIIKLFT